MNAYKLTEKPGYSLGRTSYLITSGGGIVEAQINGEQHKALAEQACAIMNGQAEPTEAVREAVHAAVAEALGEALDCTRTWSAWGAGTMGPDDFELVSEDAERVAEIADAAIAAYIKAVQP